MGTTDYQIRARDAFAKAADAPDSERRLEWEDMGRSWIWLANVASGQRGPQATRPPAER